MAHHHVETGLGPENGFMPLFPGVKAIRERLEAIGWRATEYASGCALSIPIKFHSIHECAICGASDNRARPLFWSNLMKQLSHTTVLLLLAAPAYAVDIWTVGVNNTRQGWNKFETVLTAANVPGLKKIREFAVDEKIDVSPLVVGNKLYVFTMKNTAYVFDVNTGAQLALPRQLAAPFDPADNANPQGKGMDIHNIYHSWGITATPVIDVATNTLYVTTFGKPNANSDNTERNNMLWILDANTLIDKKPPVLIAGHADNGGDEISNGFTVPYQKMRAGLGLLTDAGGNKAVVVSFSINGENPRGPGHGFVVAYD
ncbi:MAG: hypothetical protein ACXWTG_11980, partial [Methylosarcina sp.]